MPGPASVDLGSMMRAGYLKVVRTFWDARSRRTVKAMTGWLSRLLRQEPSHGRRRGTPVLWWTVAVAVAASALTVTIVRNRASELSVDSTERQVIETLEDVL